MVLSEQLYFITMGLLKINGKGIDIVPVYYQVTLMVIREGGEIMFRRKKKQHEEEKKKQEFMGLVKRCEGFCPKGEKFQYLGVKMICTGHATPNPICSVSLFGMVGMPFIPAVVGEFKDEYGVIREKVFYGKDLPALEAENRRPQEVEK